MAATDTSGHDVLAAGPSYLEARVDLMAQQHEDSGTGLTRREVLACAAMGAVAASVSPYLVIAEAFLPAAIGASGLGRTAADTRVRATPIVYGISLNFAEPVSIRVLADRAHIDADRRDVAHVMVEILDDQRRVVPIADNEITFDLQGEGRLIGVDNGNPQSHDGYKVNRCKVFHRLCLAIVQSSAKSGSIRTTASSPTLQSATLNIATNA